MLLCCTGDVVRAELRATVRLGTGELRIWNLGPGNFELTGYQVVSPSADLLASEWLPVAGRLDGSDTGDMSFDDDEWTVIAPQLPIPATSSELVEGVVSGDGGTIGLFDNLYLGQVWEVQSNRSLRFMATSGVAAPPFDVPVLYLPVGDYSEDGIVNFIDYFVWKSEFGTTGTGVQADGNADGIVNLADYTLWRDNLGATALPAEPALPLQVTSFSIPEPAGVQIIVLLALFVGAVWRMR